MAHLFKRNTFKIAVISLMFYVGGIAILSAEVEERYKIPLTLKDAILLAWKNNKDILVQESKVRAAKADILKAKSRFLPKISVTVGYTHRDSVMNLGSSQVSNSAKDVGVFVGYEDEKRAGVSIEQPIFEGGKNIVGLKLAKLNLKVQEEKLRALKLAVEFETKRLYYGILLADETERIAKQLLEQAKSHYEIVKKKFEEGASSKFDLLQSKVQVSKVIPQLVRAQNAKKLILSEFKKLVGLEPEVLVILQDKLTYSLVDLNEDNFLKIAYERNPQLVIARLDVDIGKDNISVAKAAGKPRINASFNYDYKSDDIENMFNSKHNNWNAGISIRFPLFDGFSAKARVDEAKARYTQAKLSKENLEESLALEVKKAVLNLVKARAIIESQQDSLEEAREAVKIAETRYNNGVGTNLEVLDAQVSLSQIETNLSQSIYDYVMGKAYLDKIMGISLLEEDKDEK